MSTATVIDPRDQLLTTAEVSALIKVPEPSLRQWRASGDGPPWGRFGKHVRYRLGDVLGWIDSRINAA